MSRRKAVMDLYLAFHTQQDFFTAQLYRLIQKADPGNRRRLYQAFPMQVDVFEDWYACDTEEKFFWEHAIHELLQGEEKDRYVAALGPNLKRAIRAAVGDEQETSPQDQEQGT